VTARRIGIALCVAVLCASGTYVFVYLYRWEWNRALISAAFFIAAEVALGTVAILDRLRALHTDVQGLRAASAEPDPAVLARIREAAPEPSTPFAWLAPDEARMGVFVPVLMGAGVVLSGVAWLVERLAKATARPTLERGLATRLTALSLPDGGLLPREPAPSVLDLR
jgi:hypothetical protein